MQSVVASLRAVRPFALAVPDCIDLGHPALAALKPGFDDERSPFAVPAKG